MKKIRPILILIMLISVSLLNTQCQHDDEEIIPVVGPDPIERGAETVNCTDCTPLESNGASADFSSGDIPAGVWYFDKAHSNVRWESPYKAFGSLLTGRFNYFYIDKLNFSEADPTVISFNGYVRLNSVNTGEPGRDGGCLLSTFNTDATKTSETENIAALNSVAGSGRYSSIDEGYLVDANFVFNGVSKEVTVKLYYVPISNLETYNMVGITGEFVFNALSDYAISSTNIDDQVTVKLNILLKNKI